MTLKNRPDNEQDTIGFLKCEINAYSNYSQKIQSGLAHLFLMSGSRQRRHNHKQGYSAFSHKELEQWLGRNKFNSINKTLLMFEVIEDWRKDNTDRDVEGYTKSYKLTPNFIALKLRYFDQIDNVASDIIKSKSIKTKTNALINQNISVSYKQRTPLKQLTPINHESLNQLKAMVRSVADLTGINAIEFITDIALIKKYSSNPSRTLNQRYSMSNSGRLYAKETNLQNAPRLIKNAALNGFYEYDFENCHFTLLAQLAEQKAIPCQGIQYYLKNKGFVRKVIAKDLNANISEVKKCLIALIYGASKSTNIKHAIPAIIGVEKAKVLYEHPNFKQIQDNLKKIEGQIIKAWPHKEGRQLVNAMNKKIPLTTNKKPTQNKYLLAHILQGLESAMLHIAIRLNGSNMVLCQHDGFVTKEAINEQQLIDAIASELNIKIQISKEVLTSPSKQTIMEWMDNKDTTTQQDVDYLTDNNQYKTSYKPYFIRV